jgi:hydrogenase nickel incorporation protein HypA/HybF
LASAFEQAVAETAMAGASLECKSVALEARCENCGRDFAVERFHFCCPACGHNDVTIIRGEHVLLESVTLNVAEEAGR